MLLLKPFPAQHIMGTILISTFFLNEVDYPALYYSLLPTIICGVVDTSVTAVKELPFSPMALFVALIANQFTVLLNYKCKSTLSGSWGRQIGPENTYALINIVASTLLFPLFITGLPGITTLHEGSTDQEQVFMELIRSTFLSGLFYQLQKECSFLVLNEMTSCLHSWLNTVKNVAIIVAVALVGQGLVSHDYTFAAITTTTATTQMDLGWWCVALSAPAIVFIPVLCYMAKTTDESAAPMDMWRWCIALSAPAVVLIPWLCYTAAQTREL